MFSRKLMLAALLTLISTVMAVAPATGQGDIVLTMAVSPFVENLIDDAILERFEAANPGVDVVLRTTSVPGYSPNNVEEYLDNTEEFVTQGDVLFISAGNITPETTRTGYFLDLSPLINTDISLDVNDFYPEMWQSYQWDGGIWAMPVSGDLVSLIYNPAAFDEAGLPYPDEFWTLVEFEEALRALSEYDDAGNIERSAFLDAGNAGALIPMSLAGQPVFDPMGFEAAPRFDNPTLINALDEWKRLRDDGLFINPQGEDGDVDFNEIPLIAAQTLFTTLPTVTVDFQIAPLPGGNSAMNVAGLAVSAGTEYPELAYELIKFFTSTPEAANTFFSALPARRSMVGVEGDESLGNQILSFIAGTDTDNIPILEGLMPNSFTVAEQLYISYINRAFSKMNSDGLDAQAALQEVEIEALDSIQLAQERVGTFEISVQTPEVATVTGDGVILSFGIQSFANPLPNQDNWDDAIADFVANNPQVADVQIDIVTPFLGGTFNEIITDVDCLYQPNNVVQDADLSLLLPIDPLLSSDPNISQNDLVAGALEQVRREGQVWAMPLHVQPLALWYNEQTFEQNGVFPPYSGWTVSDFENTLRNLKFSPDDPIPFQSRDGGGTYLLNLIAAYGGLPIDYSTSPLQVNFSDPASVEAIRQVLNLVRDDYLDYTPLGELGGGAFFGAGDDELSAIYSQAISGFSFGGNDDDETENYQISMFPQGQQYTALAFDVGAGYISAGTASADSCYNFLSFLTERAELFDGMPVRRSLINGPELLNSQGQAAVDFYNGLDQMMQNNNVVLFPSGFDTGAGGEALVLTWLFQAFDQYVQDDATDLDAELADAELLANAYLECLSLAPPFDPTSSNILEAYGVWRDCAVQVDPELGDLLPDFG